MLALLCENRRFFFRRDEEGACSGFDFCKTRLAFSFEAARSRVLDEHIARVLRKSSAYMIKRGALWRSDLIQNDQLVEFTYVFVCQPDLGRFCGGFRIEEDRTAHCDKLERGLIGHQVFADARGNIHYGERAACGYGGGFVRLRFRRCGRKGRGRCLRRGGGFRP
ncbi:hypothetical protein SDC9_152233 [bioreactor metagenome]|uniref:Uncharacterized protein n=1 Tax=bioreactor metagenome TaxID=1076179 RepID=A0A645EX15_9ZZZZ